ncbi:hypothetical protein A3I34_00940 [Candidatus Jorgensenbacteria bacterium RIFCSPLOWO2_02_FULL_45_12]|nr:MAG: hypothetical protein A3I34_00940 [Candidatus Jorgensenbacteria bacterium RIFCSPLOWO2_02_FULL_45_12]
MHSVRCPYTRLGGLQEIFNRKAKTMKTIIGVDAAKLAGLQIDTLQKMRSGQMTLAQLEWFNNLTKEQREAILSGKKISSIEPRFELLKKFLITVPKDYDHGTQLDTLKRKEFYFFNDAITDRNFRNATQKLVPGKTYLAKLFSIRKTATSDDCLGLYKAVGAILSGAQGMSLVYQLKRSELPKGKWTVSFDEKDALWQDPGGNHRVPSVFAYSDGGFEFDLGGFEVDWDSDHVVLCLCDCE